MDIEGGYVDDPEDAGGETYKGIARNYNPSWPGWKIIDHMRINWSTFPDCLNDSDQVVSRLEKLKDVFYKDKYWDVNLLDKFPQAVANEMFDTGVNMSPKRAAKFLQIALNAMNRNGKLYRSLEVDGKIGNKTLFAMKLCLEDEDVLIAILNTLQGMHYLKRIQQRPSQKKYIRGWFRRVK